MKRTVKKTIQTGYGVFPEFYALLNSGGLPPPGTEVEISWEAGHQCPTLEAKDKIIVPYQDGGWDIRWEGTNTLVLADILRCPYCNWEA